MQSPPNVFCRVVNRVNTKTIGERSEAIVLATFLRAGKVVLQPFGDNQRYDFVLDEGGKFIRVQVKTVHLKAGYLCGYTCSSSYHRGGKKRLYHGEADIFALYSPDTDKVYMVPVNDVGACINLRLTPAKNGQKSRVRLAKDYEFVGG